MDEKESIQTICLKDNMFEDLELLVVVAGGRMTGENKLRKETWLASNPIALFCHHPTDFGPMIRKYDFTGFRPKT